MMKVMRKNWHAVSQDKLTMGDKIADKVSELMGSWKFIIGLTVFIFIWILLNVVGWSLHWDAYPFILLNLLFSAQATYSAPLILMAANRAGDRDREQAKQDYQTNIEAERRIESLQLDLSRLETEKLDKIITLLNKKK